MAQLPQELIGRNKEGVLLEDAADDDHRVGPHNVHNDIPAKLGEIVYSYDRVFIPGQQIVQPRLVLHQVINPRPIFQGPFHVGNQASQREALLSATFQHLLDQSKHPILIEMALPQVCVSPVAHLELAALFCRGHIDAGRRQPLEMFLPQPGIDDMEGLLAALESLLDERQQYPILLGRAVKEGHQAQSRRTEWVGCSHLGFPRETWHYPWWDPYGSPFKRLTSRCAKVAPSVPI